jgi:hypothetical protein
MECNPAYNGVARRNLSAHLSLVGFQFVLVGAGGGGENFGSSVVRTMTYVYIRLISCNLGEMAGV